MTPPREGPNNKLQMPGLVAHARICWPRTRSGMKTCSSTAWPGAWLRCSAPRGSTADSTALQNCTSAVNKQLGGAVMSEGLYAYLLQHTPEHEVLRRLRDSTAMEFPVGARMQVSPEQGNFLAWLVRVSKARRAIELGTFTGYSAFCIAQALPSDGCLLACDRDPRPLQLARQALRDAGITHKVQVVQSTGTALLDSLLEQPDQLESFDFAFVDADKRGYRAYYEALLCLVRPGGIIVLDNVLWHGQVADPQDLDKRTVAMRELSAALASDERIHLSIIPLGDGLALCQRKV